MALTNVTTRPTAKLLTRDMEVHTLPKMLKELKIQFATGRIQIEFDSYVDNTIDKHPKGFRTG